MTATKYFKELDSTNEYCKRNDTGEDLIVVADRQTAGKGTKGRGFSSEKGGLYVSVMRHYENFPAENAFKIMINAAVAVCKTLQSFGAEPAVKWANDVLVNGKKICGTLIENRLNGAYIMRSIVGMGINVSNRLPVELIDIATSLFEVLGRNIPRRTVQTRLLQNLEKDYGIEEYKGYINWFGKEITLKYPDCERLAVALDVDESGNLICRTERGTEKINCAEVSLRF